MKTLLLIIVAIIIAISAHGQGTLDKRHNPTLEEARAFFDWRIDALPVYNGDGKVIPGVSEFRSTKGHTLHVGNATYNPAQPLVAFDKAVQSLDAMGLAYSVNGVGSFENDAKVFAQFNIGEDKAASSFGYRGSKFDIGGKEYQGLVTMVKGSDTSLPLAFFLTIVCIVCANTFRMAIGALRKEQKKGAEGLQVTMKQTKNSEGRLNTIEKEIMALFGLQDTVQATLRRMSHSPVTISQAERAFLGLLKEDEAANLDMTPRGKTRLGNSLERYKGAFANSPGVNGKTMEDWFNAVTYVDTHGNKESKSFDADKQWLSSNFGAYANRKERAFELASNPSSFAKLVRTGDSVMEQLTRGTFTLSQAPSQQDTTFADLLAK